MRKSIAPILVAVAASSALLTVGTAQAQPVPQDVSPQCQSSLDSIGRPYRESNGDIAANGTFQNCAGKWNEVCVEMWAWLILPAPGTWVPVGSSCSANKDPYPTTFQHRQQHQPGMFHAKLVGINPDGSRGELINSETWSG